MFVWKRRDRRMDESRVVLKYNEGIPAMNKETEVEIIKKFIVKNKQERIIWKLQNAKKRKKVFWHFDHPDIFKKEILYPSTYKDAEHLEKVLYEMSGTRECYVIGECYIWAIFIRKTHKPLFCCGHQPTASWELSSIYSAIRRNSSAYLNFTLMFPPS